MKTKVLMVCLGNICRSPLAEGILASKVNLEKVTVDSAGTGGYHIGNLPDSRSIEVATKFGIDIGAQRCRKLRAIDLDEYDLIYAMDKSNHNNIIGLATNETQISKVKLLLDELNLQDNEVPDPYYGCTDGFEKVFLMIDSACEIIAQNLNRE